MSLTAAQGRAIARFLATPEDAEASCPDKAPMERECLRTGWGRCDECGRPSGPLFRYEVDGRHAERFMGCLHADDFGVCPDCAEGHLEDDLLGADDAPDIAVECDGAPCRVAEMLEDRALPWVCPSCWRELVAEEQAHVEQLEAAS